MSSEFNGGPLSRASAMSRKPEGSNTPTPCSFTPQSWFSEMLRERREELSLRAAASTTASIGASCLRRRSNSTTSFFRSTPTGSGTLFTVTYSRALFELTAPASCTAPLSVMPLPRRSKVMRKRLHPLSFVGMNAEAMSAAPSSPISFSARTNVVSALLRRTPTARISAPFALMPLPVRSRVLSAKFLLMAEVRSSSCSRLAPISSPLRTSAVSWLCLLSSFGVKDLHIPPMPSVPISVSEMVRNCRELFLNIAAASARIPLELYWPTTLSTSSLSRAIPHILLAETSNVLNMLKPTPSTGVSAIASSKTPAGPRTLPARLRVLKFLRLMRIRPSTAPSRGPSFILHRSVRALVVNRSRSRTGILTPGCIVTVSTFLLSTTPAPSMMASSRNIFLSDRSTCCTVPLRRPPMGNSMVCTMTTFSPVEGVMALARVRAPVMRITLPPSLRVLKVELSCTASARACIPASSYSPVPFAVTPHILLPVRSSAFNDVFSFIPAASTIASGTPMPL
mmetsp:Transcript_20872/g.39682  ORF Transcript_20872/g.39682 Transcript_20872/m.39682 type:complete len:510 (+) Transcript_20872:622-2151(+)